MSAPSRWLSSDPDKNRNFRRRWTEPDWLLRLDRRAARDGPPNEKRRLGTVAAAHQPKSKSIINASDSNRNEQVFQARRDAEAIFPRISS
jgi:hypothetical protein